MTVSRWAARQASQDPNTTADELTETANRLLYRQFISRSDAGGATHFDRISNNLEFFKDLFASFGFRLVFNDGWGYVGYVSPSAFSNARVPTQETIVLLCLRLLYGEGAEKGYFIDSSADILVDEEEIQTVFASIGSRTLKSGELRAILTAFKRQGLITFDQSHTLQVSAEVTIRPTITEVVDESFVARLEAWAGQSAESAPGASVDGFSSVLPSETDDNNPEIVSPEKSNS
jgi:hypothetical protein